MSIKPDQLVSVIMGTLSDYEDEISEGDQKDSRKGGKEPERSKSKVSSEDWAVQERMEDGKEKKWNILKKQRGRDLQ